ncbi:MAG: GNAT family N-acetyltransferase [Desulfobacterales bacterium]|nr:GNAT family N-acetyltransferase [Desulfobacterales bacterium]
MDIKLIQAKIEDLEEILALQKIAYRSEAEIHNDFSIPPLHQTLSEIREEFQHQLFLKVVEQGKIIGSVRAYEKKGTCFIGKLIVHPLFQNQGIGTKLLPEIEGRFEHAKRFELFTGYKSKKNLYLYNKLGYKEFKRNTISDKLTLIFLEKISNIA